ncbi:MAG: SDR family oxidoreductase [Bacteroidales bacterium]|nr:SDR family oxidoreductase [Bacteroidales bacterium]
MRRKALFIGGTGTISSAITAQLAAEGEWELTLLNRGNRNDGVPANVRILQADINDDAAVEKLLADTQWDCVCDFIGFVPAQVERDWRLFKGRTKQYMYISSASAYQKPAASPFITEGTPLVNPYWQYSRDKIACENFLMEKHRSEGFPVTIIRPSHTYDERSVPLGVHGDNGSWQVLQRMLDGKPVIIHGDGTSQWTLTHNSDFAKGFIGLMGNPHALGNTFHITSDETLTWNQIYQTIADALGVPLKAVHVSSEFLDAAGPYDFRGGLIGDKATTVLFDNAKLKRAVPGFQATVRFEQGVRRTIAHIFAHPELQRPDPAFDAWCDRVIDALETAKASLR